MRYSGTCLKCLLTISVHESNKKSLNKNTLPRFNLHTTNYINFRLMNIYTLSKFFKYTDYKFYAKRKKVVTEHMRFNTHT